MSLRASSTTYLAAQKETTYGTYIAPSSTGLWLPITNPQPDDQIKYVDDTGLRGSMVTSYNAVQTVSEASYAFDVAFFADSTAGLAQAILGGPDATASVGASLWSHTFSLLNNSASTGNQPTSFSLTDFDGFEARGYAGSEISDLTIKWQADGLVTCTTKWLTYLSASVATPASTQFSTLAPVPAWNAVTTIGGVASTHLESGEINFSRKAQAVYTANATQSAFRNFVGAINVTFKATFSAEDDTEYNYYRNNTQPTFDWKITDPEGSANQTFEVHANQAVFKVGKPVRSKEYLEWDMEGTFLANTTDATAGGYSPVKVIATNGRSAAY